MYKIRLDINLGVFFKKIKTRWVTAPFLHKIWLSGWIQFGNKNFFMFFLSKPHYNFIENAYNELWQRIDEGLTMFSHGQ